MRRLSSDDADDRTCSGVREEEAEVAGRDVVKRQVRIGGVS